MKNTVIKKGVEREASLNKSIYFSDSYFDKKQLFTLCEQIDLIYRYSKKQTSPKILEIGKGNGLVSNFIKDYGVYIETFDINENLNPDILGNIVEINKFVSTKYSMLVACEVLEHLPFQYFEETLKQLDTVSNELVIITLPEFRRIYGANISLLLPKIGRINMPFYCKLRWRASLGEGHFWEINSCRKTMRVAIENVIKKYFNIIEKGVFESNPNHNYYVLSKF